MNTRTQRIIRKAIIDFTKSNSTYHKGITDLLIDDLLSQLEVKEQAQADLKKRGLIINVSRDEGRPFYTTNPSNNIVYQSVKMVQSILRQLSISPDAILKLKLDESKNTLADLHKLLNEN